MTERPAAGAGYDGSEIAIVGMAGRFPGAPDLDAFWRNLEQGVESIASFSRDELLAAGEEAARIDDPAYVPARPVLDGVELFDAAFFGFSPREAEVLDPQLRVFLECAWTALEDAGHDAERFRGRISLFAGAGFSNYLVHNLYKNRPVMEAFGDQQTTIFNVQDSLVTMVGYKLNLRGICCAVQTFCSTSLVGVHLAVQNLLNYESDLALAGGVTIDVPQTRGYLYEEGSILSPDGHCRTFDARAGGTIFGNGVGIVVLRRLQDALADGDTVHAVVRGSAVNNDGSLKVSFAAPGVMGQTEVVVEALSAADVDPDTIGYVEAHGTGTRLGDPAEVSALTKAFRTRTARRGFCALGSVKTNVGHLDAAAGVAGLIKAVLSLEHGRIPPSLHFETPNPAIDFSSTPFFVNATPREWPRGALPRRAGVSAFGVGGTNAHVIVEEGPAAARTPSARSHQLLVLSARTLTALATASEALARRLETRPELELADVAHTLQVGRRAFDQRRFVVAASREEAVAALRQAVPVTAACQRRNPPVVAFFGRGEAAPVGAARAIYEQAPVFREAFLQCVEAAHGFGRSMGEALYPAPGREEAAGRALREEGLGPLAAFALEFAWGRLWQSWGVRFERMAGEGVGARVAECLGAADVPAALRRAVERVRPGAALDEAPSEGREAALPWRDLAEDPARLLLEVSGGAVGLRPAGDDRVAPTAPVPSAATYAQALRVLGQLWMAGVDVDWPALHAPERRRRLPLPTYPFERERFWVDPLVEGPPPEERRPSEWLYRPVWKTALPVSADAAGGREPALVFADSHGVGLRIAEHWRRGGAEVVTVSRGTAFGGDPASGYTLDPGEAGHYASLWADLGSRRWMPRRVLHLWGLEPLDGSGPARARFERASDEGFYSLLHLVAARPEGPLDLKVVAAGLHDVTGGDALSPERAPLVPLCRVLVQEHHDLRCALVDVEPPAGDLERLAEVLSAELALEDAEPLVAYRRGRRWLQDFERVPAPAQEKPSPRVRPEGVYLITGGLGDVGFVLALALAHVPGAKLVLTGRRGLPPRDGWAAWLETHEAADEAAVRIQKVRALEKLGAEVLVLPADAASADEMGAAVRAARERFGAVHGVIHAAGELSSSTFLPVAELGREACERQFAPKVHGLAVLAEALRGESLDFCLLTSSVSSVLGGLGYAAYAGANAFMDAFAARQHQRGERPWMSVDWDQWEFAGRTPSGPARAASRDGATLKPEDGVAVFERLLRLRDVDRVVVSRGPLAPRLERWVRLTAGEPAPGPAAGARAAAARPRPPLSTAYVAPGSAPEKALAAIWQELLGIEKIGIHDNFFELGGHSLFAARVLSRVRSALKVSLSLEAIFEAPTIAELAGRVAAAGGEPPFPGTEAKGERVEIEI